MPERMAERVDVDKEVRPGSDPGRSAFIESTAGDAEARAAAARDPQRPGSEADPVCGDDLAGSMIYLQCMRPNDPALPASTPEEGVFENSLLKDVEDTTVLKLPFHAEDVSPAASFYRTLKMQIEKGFLALRGILSRRGPPG